MIHYFHVIFSLSILCWNCLRYTYIMVLYYLSFFVYLIDRIRSLRQGVQILEFWRKNLSTVFLTTCGVSLTPQWSWIHIFSFNIMLKLLEVHVYYGVVLSFFLRLLDRSNTIITSGSANFGILKKKSFDCIFDYMWSVLNSSVVLDLTTKGERLLHCGIVRGKKEFYRASLYVWYLQYWTLCDALVVFKLRTGNCLFL